MCASKSSSDFTNYYPAGSLSTEDIKNTSTSSVKLSMRHTYGSSKVKKKIALFSKKSGINHLQQAHVRPLCEDLTKCKDMSRYVSQEELRALQGCVSKRRAIFSSGHCVQPSTIPHRHSRTGSYCEQMYSSKTAFSTLRPLECHQFLSSSDNHLLAHSSKESSMEEDTVCFSQSSIPDSVSVQFRTGSQDCASQSSDGSHFERIELLSNETYHTNGVNYHNTQARKYDHSNPKAYVHFTEQKLSKIHFHNVMSNQENAPNLYVTQQPHSQLQHNSWPRNRVCEQSSRQCTFEPGGNRDNFGKSQSMSPRRRHELAPLCTNVSSSLTNNFKVLETETYGSLSSVFSVQSRQSSITSYSERPHFTFMKGVDGIDFKERTDQIVSWFKEFNDQQRNILLQKLVEESDCAQMHFLSLQMEPILHMGCPQNCQDLLSWLPSYITEKVLGYLDPVSLCQASQVSHKWHQLANQQKMWMKLCKLNQWQLSSMGEAMLIESYTSADGIIQWKSVFAEKFRLKRNWLKGYCTVRTFNGHTQGISCIQFDETRIVSGSWDKTIKVWNRRTNTAWAALTLEGHSGTVRCLHLHGNRLVSGSSDRTIKVWDLSTDKIGWVGAACRATMVGHQHTVRCLQADNSKVISGSYDLTLKVWDITTGQCTKTLMGHTDAVLCLQFAGDFVVSGSKDMTIKVWSLSSGSCKLTLYGHQAAVTCVQFDETKIISGALDTLIKIWNFYSGECVRTMDWIRSEGHTGVIRHLQADNWKIISAADDKTMKVWSVHTGNRLLTLKSHTDGVTCLQFNDKVIVSGSYDKAVKLWDFSAC